MLSDAVPQEIDSGDTKLALGNDDDEALILKVLKQLTKVDPVLYGITAGH